MGLTSDQYPLQIFEPEQKQKTKKTKKKKKKTKKKKKKQKKKQDQSFYLEIFSFWGKIFYIFE